MLQWHYKPIGPAVWYLECLV